MKAHELIEIGKSMFEKLTEVGLNLSDIQHYEMYQDFVNMKKDGLKVTYIVSYLSEQYEVSESKIYNIVKKYELEIPSN